MRRKPFKSFLIILAATFVSQFGLSNTIDPALLVSNAQMHKDKVLHEIENGQNEKILLKAGNERFGLHHILKRHSGNYFTGESKKGILFPAGTTGKQIIEGIEQVYKYGEPDPKGKGNKKVLLHETEVNGEKSNFRLVINDQNEIITFYKLKQKS